MDKSSTTIYKGLAILLVILCHAAGAFGHGITLFTPCGGIGVAIFLLLSGYGLNEAWNLGGGKSVDDAPSPPFHCWWRKRFLTVWLPYILLQLLAYWPFQPFDLCPFLLDLSCLKPLYHNGWYLQYLFLWYAIFYVVRRVKFLDDRRIAVFTIISIVCFFALREIKAEQSLSFWAGIMLSERKELQEKLFHVQSALAFLLFGIACLALKQVPDIRSAPQLAINAVQLGIKLPAGLGLMALCQVALRQKWLKFSAVILSAVGIISYELYLMHGYVLLAVPKRPAGVVVFVTMTSVLSLAFWWVMRQLRPVLSRIMRVAQNTHTSFRWNC